MNPVFNIPPADIITEETSLFAEVSTNGFSYFFLNEKTKSIEGLTVFHFDTKETENNIPGLLKKIFEEQSLLKNTYCSVFISYAFCESILTPVTYYNATQNSENIDLVYGDLHDGIIFTDDIQEKNLYNVYRIPYDIYQTVSGQFPLSKITHQYSGLVKRLPQTGNVIKIIFYQNRIVITLLKNDKLQIIQTFSYATSEDVVYHMLNVCNQFQVKQIDVELNGMIEKDSALFKQIHKYFLVTNFSCLPDTFSYPDGIKEYPPHFFSHLFSFALCV